MKKIFFVFLVTIFICSTHKVESANLYSRQTGFPPIKLSQENLKALMSSIEAYVVKANGESVTSIVQQVEISDGERTITYKGAAADLPIERLPEICYKLTYLYYPRTSDDTPVSQVVISFNDDYRSLTVQGFEPEQVDGLFLLIQDDVLKFTSHFSGSGFRFLLTLSIYILLIVAGSLLSHFYEKWWYLVLGCFCALTIMIGEILLPVQKVLPGFALISGEASWIRRYSAEIGFYGLIITVLLAVIPLTKLGKRHSSKKNLQTTE